MSWESFLLTPKDKYTAMYAKYAEKSAIKIDYSTTKKRDRKA